MFLSSSRKQGEIRTETLKRVYLKFLAKALAPFRWRQAASSGPSGKHQRPVGPTDADTLQKCLRHEQRFKRFNEWVICPRSPLNEQDQVLLQKSRAEGAKRTTAWSGRIMRRGCAQECSSRNLEMLLPWNVMLTSTADRKTSSSAWCTRSRWKMTLRNNVLGRRVCTVTAAGASLALISWGGGSAQTHRGPP